MSKVKRGRRAERHRLGGKGCAHCGGTGKLPLFRFDGDNNIVSSAYAVPCSACATPPPLVSVGVSDGPWPPDEIPALRPALDAAREARRRGEGAA